MRCWNPLRIRNPKAGDAGFEEAMSEHQHPPSDFNLPVLEDEAPEGSRFGKAHHILLAFAGLALIAWLLSGIYTVNANEVVIIERFGQYLTAAEGKPMLVQRGLHYRMPWPIDRVHKIPIERQSIIEVKTFNEPPDAYADFKRTLQNQYMKPEVISALYDPYLITGDKNIVHVEVHVSYRLDDPAAWLGTVALGDAPEVASGRREQLFKSLIEHAMISQIAKLEVENVILKGQDRLPSLLSDAIKEGLLLKDPRDPTGATMTSLGIRVERVDVVASRPPQMVQGAFDEVIKAMASKDAMENQGKAAKMEAEVKARGHKAAQKQQAEAYSSEVVNTAKGEASRFAQIYEQYKQAPDITRWAVWNEAVRSVSGNAVRQVFAQTGQKLMLQIDPPQFDEKQNNQQR
jgi:membrane protease subunit HflK